MGNEINQFGRSKMHVPERRGWQHGKVRMSTEASAGFQM